MLGVYVFCVCLLCNRSCYKTYFLLLEAVKNVESHCTQEESLLPVL